MCVLSAWIAMLLTALVLNIPVALCLLHLSREDLDKIIKYLNYVTGKIMLVESWISLTVSPDAHFVQNITKIIVAL